MKNSFISRSS